MFEPVFVKARSNRKEFPPLSYNTYDKERELNIRIGVDLVRQISIPVKAWRMDVDRKAGRMRLTALIQHDGNPATRTHRKGNNASIYIAWKRTEDLEELFPATVKGSGSVPLENIRVDSRMGIEFDIPKGAAAWAKIGAGKPKNAAAAEPEPEPEPEPKPKSEPAPSPKGKAKTKVPGRGRGRPSTADEAMKASEAELKRMEEEEEDRLAAKALEYRDMFSCTIEEVADLMSLPKGRVLALLNRARKKGKEVAA